MGRKRKINELELIYLYGLGMTHEQIAQKLNVSRSAVTLALQKVKEEFPDLLKAEDLEEFRKGETDDLASMRRMILSAMKQKVLKMNVKDISFQQLSMIYGVLFDKDRLLRGESTEHVAHLHKKELGHEDKKLIQETIAKMTQRALTQSSEEAMKEMAEHSERSGESEND